MDRSPAQSPHDALFKGVFSDLQHARPLLQAALPEGLSRAINWSALELRPGSFVDEALRARHSDLLFSTRLNESPLFLYLLFEHQSTADPWMPLRLLRYMLAIWQRHFEEAPRSRRLPIVVPIVIHHSERGWTFDPAFESLFDLDAEGLGEALSYVPRFRFVLDDVSHATDDDLRRRAVTSVAKLTLACLRSSRAPETLLEAFVPWLDLLQEVRQAPHGLHAFQRILRYIFLVAGQATDGQLHAFIERVSDPKLAEEIVTLAEMLETRGRRDGLKKGRAAALLQLLRAKFGQVPAAAAARVETAEEPALERWLDRFVHAGSMAEVFDD